MNNRKPLISILCLLALFAVTACSDQLTHTEETPPPPQTTATYSEEAASNIVFYSSNGESKELLDYVGKPIVLKFINCSDETAAEELASLSDLYDSHNPEKEFIVILQGTKSNPTVEELVPFPIFYDPDNSASMTYDTNGVSSTFFIDKDGFIATKSTHPITPTELEFGLDLL